MVEKLSDEMLYEGVSVDITFHEPLPCFGDLFRICGDTHPRFAPTGDFGFEHLSDLQFEQVDDYFGVRSLTEEGDDVPVWLFPLVRDEVVEHHPGPFDGIRLSYNILRNPVRRFEHFLRCVKEFAMMGANVEYRTRKIELGSPLDVSPLLADISAVTQHWAENGITVGSHEALSLNY